MLFIAIHIFIFKSIIFILLFYLVLSCYYNRPTKFLSILSEINKSSSSSTSTTSTGGNSATKDDMSSLVPVDIDDRNMFLKWSFYEATLLIRQYGDIIEELR